MTTLQQRARELAHKLAVHFMGPEFLASDESCKGCRKMLTDFANEALEAAAKWHEEQADDIGKAAAEARANGHPLEVRQKMIIVEMEHRRNAAAIRAMKEE